MISGHASPFTAIVGWIFRQNTLLSHQNSCSNIVLSGVYCLKVGLSHSQALSDLVYYPLYFHVSAIFIKQICHGWYTGLRRKMRAHEAELWSSAFLITNAQPTQPRAESHQPNSLLIRTNFFLCMLLKFCGGGSLTIANWYNGLDDDGSSGSEKPGVKYLMHYQNLTKVICEVPVKRVTPKPLPWIIKKKELQLTEWKTES